MEFMKAVFNKGPNPDNLRMGDVLALWDVARNKIIGLSTLSVYYLQAKDKDLKDLLDDGINIILKNHVNKIQKLLLKRGYNFPASQGWEKKLDKDAQVSIPSTVINDEEIAISLREIIRLTLSLETEGLRNATDKEIRDLLTEILDDDNTGYSALLALQRKKDWKDFPPALYSH